MISKSAVLQVPVLRVAHFLSGVVNLCLEQQNDQSLGASINALG